MLVFDTGRVFGTDTTGARYDGGYLYNGVNNSADVKIKVTFPPNVMAVFGIANPYEWSIDITATFNPKLDTGPIRLRNPAQADHRFQSNPISDSDASRSLIPVQADHQFRDEADQFSVGGGIKSAWIKPVASDAG